MVAMAATVTLRGGASIFYSSIVSSMVVMNLLAPSFSYQLPPSFGLLRSGGLTPSWPRSFCRLPRLSMMAGLESRTVAQLREIITSLGGVAPSKWKKAELISCVEGLQGAPATSASDVASVAAAGGVVTQTGAYDKLTVGKLKDILKSRGLKIGGVKSELVTRLEESEALDASKRTQLRNQGRALDQVGDDDAASAPDPATVTQASVSDVKLDDDFLDHFNDFSFIKDLPPRRNRPRPSALPKKTRTAPRVTLVLDLDETLVHASLEHMDDSHLNFKVNFHSQDYQVWVKIRPHCQEFLERLADKFELIVFTSAQRIYADIVLNFLDPERRLIKHRVFRDSCVLARDNNVKDLTVLSRDLSQVAIVDNSPRAFCYQLSNGIPIQSWFGDTEDRCLLKLLPFLESLSEVEDVRPHIENKFKLHDRVAAARLDQS
mmetsp:Transcript_86924/g.127137  ORF Transcript_86924/g.127137 Transcript_86924/m.127137 type:complete len:433 (+) Transcript_86924:456-1754(+)